MSSLSSPLNERRSADQPYDEMGAEEEEVKTLTNFEHQRHSTEDLLEEDPTAAPAAATAAAGGNEDASTRGNDGGTTGQSSAGPGNSPAKGKKERPHLARIRTTSTASAARALDTATPDEEEALSDTKNAQYNTHSDERMCEVKRKGSVLKDTSMVDTFAAPVEIAIETTSKITARTIFGMWYLVLLVALILQSIATVQWECSNVCGGSCSFTHFNWDSSACVHLRDAEHFTQAPSSSAFLETAVTSGLAAAEAVATFSPDSSEKLVDIVWYGSFSRIFDSHLNRFVHFIFDIPRPDPFPTTESSISYELNFAILLENVTIDENGKRIKTRTTASTLSAPVVCYTDAPRCTTAVLQTSATSITNDSTLILSLEHIPVSLANSSLKASVGSVYQRSGYTKAALSLRYVMLFISIVVTTRFIFSLLHNQTKGREWLYEQTWVLILETGLFWYLNPFAAWCVFDVPENKFLSFVEFRFPLYFLAAFIGFMFALIASCMSWQRHNSHHPPWGAKLCSGLFILVIVTIDIADVGYNNWDWGMEHCPNLECSPLGYLFYGTFAAGFILCTWWLWWLTSNLGGRPYLSCRPQQLALRLFIFLFSTYVVYLILSFLVILIFFRGVSSIIVFQTSTQIGPCMVAFSFVTIMAYCYTSMNRNHDLRRVPFHAADVRWKKIVWPTKWFEWLSVHGGSTYIFYSEKEERDFYEIQSRFSADPKFFDSEEYDPNEYTDEKEESSATESDGFLRQRHSGRLESPSDQSWKTTIFNAPGALLEKVENRIVDTAVHTFHWDRRKPFFCLETAIDCHNLSYEAYGVPESDGDAQIITGFNVTLPSLPCWCLKKREETDDTESNQDPFLPGSPESPEGNGMATPNPTPVSPPGRDEGESGAFSPTMGSPSHPRHKPGSAAASWQGAAAVTINVEQYGYYQLAVVEALAVQVVISELIVDSKLGKDRQSRLVIAIRGTDNLANVANDLQISRISWPEMECSTWEEKTGTAPSVQKGFLEPWNALRDPLLENIFGLIATRPDHRFYITGHSLGGALATLCAYTLQKRLAGVGHAHPEPTVYTYGTPRVGNRAFAKEYMKKVPRTFRIVNESDVVSHVSLHGGNHVGIEVIVDRHGNFLVEPMYIEQTFRPITGKGSSISHHSLGSYGDSLSAVASASHFGHCPVRCLKPYYPASTIEMFRSDRKALLASSPKMERYGGALYTEATTVLV